jgi:transcriptional regulator with XRE-family HTH domain
LEDNQVAELTESAATVVGRQVRTARKWLRLSQGELAQRLTQRGRRTHQATIARLERGERSATVDDVLAIAAALGVSPLWLLSGSYTSEPVPVLPDLTASPARMRHWIQGAIALPGTDETAFVEVVPDDERRLRLRRGVQNMQQCLADFAEAANADDRPGELIALADLKRELERQEDDLRREERLAGKEWDNG